MGASCLDLAACDAGLAPALALQQLWGICAAHRQSCDAVPAELKVSLVWGGLERALREPRPHEAHVGLLSYRPVKLNHNPAPAQLGAEDYEHQNTDCVTSTNCDVSVRIVEAYKTSCAVA